jgi:hypothetical protein
MDIRQRRQARSLSPTPALVMVAGDLDPLPVRRRAMHDPYDQPPDVFREVYARPAPQRPPFWNSTVLMLCRMIMVSMRRFVFLM